MLDRPVVLRDPAAMEALVLRPALPADIPALNALIVKSARALSVGYYSAAQIDSAIRYVFGVDSRLVADGSYFVAERSGVLAGCGGWSRFRTLYGGDQRPVGGDDRLDPHVDAARIRAFFVAPTSARQGVGRALLAACASAAAANGFTRLELMATLPGVPLYSAMGFTALRSVEDRLPDGTVLPFVQMGCAITELRC
jgi:GNAT superfamily N-acetyltransferase